MLSQSLQQVLTAYSPCYAPVRWECLGSSAGFSGAVITRLETSAGAFCLRGWPAGSLPKPRILGLHRFLKTVFEAGVPEVAAPVPALNGETLISWQNGDWQLEPWMPGTADFWNFPTRARLKNVMAKLAAFHRAARHYTDEGPARIWFYHQDLAPSPAVAERLEILRDWRQVKIQRLTHCLSTEPDRELGELAAEFVSRFHTVARVVESQLELLSRAGFRLQPCLRDVWHDHVLFSGDEVTGLIDASACRSEHVATDLARLLGSLLGDDRERWMQAVQTYEHHGGPLDSHERALIEALDQSGVLLSGMIWLERLLLDRETVSHRPKVMERLKSLRERLKTLDTTICRTFLP